MPYNWAKKNFETAPSRTNRLILTRDPFGPIGLRLVEDDRHVFALTDELAVTPVHHFLVCCIGLNDEEHLVHKRTKGPGRARRPQWWHVKNDIIEIACLEVRHQIEKSLQTELRGSAPGRSDRGQVKIVRSRIHWPALLKGRRERVRRLAFEERVDVTRAKVDVNKKNLAFVGFRQRTCEACGQGRRASFVGKA